MSTNSAIDGKVDRQHVTLATDVSSLYWETKLGAARGDIEQAIRAVGEAPDDVARWLRDAHKSHIRPEVQRSPPH
jgi:hypothetical protein